MEPRSILNRLQAELQASLSILFALWPDTTKLKIPLPAGRRVQTTVAQSTAADNSAASKAKGETAGISRFHTNRVENDQSSQVWTLTQVTKYRLARGELGCLTFPIASAQKRMCCAFACG